MNITVVLPSYNPTEKLVETVNSIIDEGFDDIVVVNDGSGEKSLKYFEDISRLPQCVILNHEKNMGKGRALKTAFAYTNENRKTCGIITTDDDGQLSAEDMRRCAEEMEKSGEIVFGVRDFKGKNVPKSNKAGNKITCFVFMLFCGIRLSDTQTGLRAIPMRFLPAFIKASGERFEYETNMLLSMKENGFPYKQLSIKTIYGAQSKKETHFNPLIDSIKIYAIILKFLLSSLSCSVIDITLFTVINLCINTGMDETARVFIATAAARVISSLVNFTLNRRKVFKSDVNLGKSMLKYYTLCVGQMLASYLLVIGATLLFGAQQSGWQTVIKLVIDTLLFVLSFNIQREWVFNSLKKKE